MLFIDIDDIKDDGYTLDEDVPRDLFPQLCELVASGVADFPEPIRLHVTAQRIAGLIEVSGKVESVVELSCGRCLESYRRPVKASFSLTYVDELPECLDEEGDELELTAEEMGMSQLDGEEIALLEPLQEQLLMALPIQPLCDNECKGLCPHCGVNLNDEQCDCEPPPFDTRFAALKDFKANK